jgi:Ran GTPase-activating protein (RanGAP) involved in mRNA processing and transport
MSYSDNSLDASTLEHLAQHLPVLPALRRLTLADNPLNPSAVPALLIILRKSPALEELHLDTTGLGDAGCAIFAARAEPVLHLHWLSLGDNGLTHAGVTSIAEAIKVQTQP